MIVFRYDKTFEGLLSAVFDAYVRKVFPEKLLNLKEPAPMFAENIYTVYTEPDKTERVWKALNKKLSKYTRNMIMHVWLSENPDSDVLIFRYIKKIFDSDKPVQENFADPDVLEVKQIATKVAKESEYIKQFVRLQKAADGTFFAPIAPKYNALPIAIGYFKDRFADQKWLIYDTKRRYGYYYDLEKLREVTMEDDEIMLKGKLDDSLMAEDEKFFQKMWKDYFKAITIKERINPKLHRQNMPKRFWKYLTEKQ